MLFDESEIVSLFNDESEFLSSSESDLLISESYPVSFLLDLDFLILRFNDESYESDADEFLSDSSSYEGADDYESNSSAPSNF